MKRVLVTGASGFVGGLLTRRLRDAGYALNLAGRAARDGGSDGNIRYFAVGEVGPHTDWRPALEGCDAVVHLAALVHRPDAAEQDYDAVNNLGTARLAELAAEGSPKTLIFLSSLAAVSDNFSAKAVNENTAAEPVSPYGRSKLAAERHVGLFSRTGRVGISLRPPVVYGSRAPANWHQLQRLAATGLPLPFGAVHNRRSLLAVENLVDAIIHLLELPADRMRPGSYLIADDQVVSLTQIMTWLRSGMGRPCRLIPVPDKLLWQSLAMIGKGRIARSLLDNLEVDSTRFRETFGWNPKISTRDGIIQSGAGFQR